MRRGTCSQERRCDTRINMNGFLRKRHSLYKMKIICIGVDAECRTDQFVRARVPATIGHGSKWNTNRVLGNICVVAEGHSKKLLLHLKAAPSISQEVSNFSFYKCRVKPILAIFIKKGFKINWRLHFFSLAFNYNGDLRFSIFFQDVVKCAVADLCDFPKCFAFTNVVSLNKLSVHLLCKGQYDHMADVLFDWFDQSPYSDTCAYKISEYSLSYLSQGQVPWSSLVEVEMYNRMSRVKHNKRFCLW